MAQHRRHRGLPAFSASKISRCRTFLAGAFVAVLVAVFATSPAQAQRADAGSWIDTWSASPQPVWEPDFFAPLGIPRTLRNQTIRHVARISLGGNRVRVEFSNEYGEHPLVIGAAHVALAGEKGGMSLTGFRTLGQLVDHLLARH